MGRKIYILRHGERCDSIRNNYPSRGEGFLKLAFDENGNYKPHDPILPKTLPDRSDGWRAYGFDPPLTQKGLSSAELTGSLFKEKAIDIDFIYSSPALRCVQTANKFVQGYGKPLKIRIEPGLFEWLEWFKIEIPSWIPPDEYDGLENILIVGHVGNLETCTRSILRTERHSRENYYKMTSNMEYLTCKELERSACGKYVDNGRPIPSIGSGVN